MYSMFCKCLYVVLMYVMYVRLTHIIKITYLLTYLYKALYYWLPQRPATLWKPPRQWHWPAVRLQWALTSAHWSPALHGRPRAIRATATHIATIVTNLQLSTSDILVLKWISVLVFILFSSQNFYFI